MYLIDDLPGYIDLGQLSEKGAKEIEFDVTEWVTEHPTGTFSISYIRPTETTVYPVAAGDISTATALGVTTLTWAISDAVTAIAGSGSVVVQLAVADTVVKRSRLVQTIVQEGHSSAGDPPDPFQDWLTELTALQTLWDGVDLSVSSVAPEVPASGTITQDGTGTHITLAIPTGATGPQGPQGVAGANGTDGADGQDGASAYTQAQTGGYGGSLADFYADLAAIEGLAAELAAL